MRSVNTTSSVVADDDYCIPPMECIDLDYVLNLVHEHKYCILHAPRQTGKTSALKALQDQLNSGAEGDISLSVRQFGGWTGRSRRRRPGDAGDSERIRFASRTCT